MEFMVEIAVALPPSMDSDERSALLSRELGRGRELVAAGSIRSIWRVPGGLRNVGIWEAEDATELHALIESLPLYPWLTAEVTPLARHPLAGLEPG
ncbi:MAG: muconolactone Delta-isomerase family protein [Actinobacteria bacterium]|nr:muconolactone Delta-isomerase family protein [Actinomycetota bacterium]